MNSFPAEQDGPAGQPADLDAGRRADLVLEGGGVKGIGLVGAIRRPVTGSSAWPGRRRDRSSEPSSPPA